MTIKSNFNKFNIVLPDEWEDRSIYTFMGPEDSGVQHMLTLIIDPYAEDRILKEYARERIDVALESLQGVDIIKEEEITLANGFPAYECVYKWIPVNGQIFFQKLVYVLHNGIGYSFSANFSKKTFKTIGVRVNEIINSFSPGSGN